MSSRTALMVQPRNGTWLAGPGAFDKLGDASAEVALDDAEIIATTPARDEDDDAEDAATTRGGRALGRTRSRRGAHGGCPERARPAPTP